MSLTSARFGSRNKSSGMAKLESAEEDEESDSPVSVGDSADAQRRGMAGKAASENWRRQSIKWSEIT